jgi:hypothetical protein
MLFGVLWLSCVGFEVAIRPVGVVVAGSFRARVFVRQFGVAMVSVSLIAGVSSGLARAGAAGAMSSTSTSPRVAHAYRHGAVPLRSTHPDSFLTAESRASVTLRSAGSRGRLTYHGGSVMTGQPKVYLVFWGSQWGTQSTVGGYRRFSGDSEGMAPYLQAFFAGLGTNDELWSAAATKYCEGVTFRAVACPITAPSVRYPVSGALAGVWEDTSFTPPTGPPGVSSTPRATATERAFPWANPADRPMSP